MRPKISFGALLRRKSRAMRVGALALVCACVGLIAMPQFAVAQGLQFSSKSQSNSLFGNKLSVLDGRAASQYGNSHVLKPKRDDGGTGAAWRGQYAGPYLDVARAAALKHGVPSDLFLRLVQRESGWNDTAVSVKGALGLAQLMPETADLLGVDPHDPHQNLDGGARYLRRMYDKFGNWRLALAAYNAGPGAVEQYGGIPPYAETTAYVAAIFGG